MEYSLIGKILGDRYEILEIIGSGGMATVYKARCRLLNRYVAVKVLKESLKNDDEVVKRFTTESRASASLSHHNIVSVYDVGETDSGLNYIVMEYVDGITLKEYIKRNYRLDWREACEFACQIAMALECAHEHGIIHRDIKPHNILLTKDHTLKVADFGIARTAGSDTVITSNNNSVFGSVHYISPEQARGGYVDAASDVYSLGVVLYEMLTGKLPFDGENAVSVALMKLENDPEDVRDIVSLPDSVAEVVMRAVAKEQHIRYQSAAEMAYDLREVLDGGIKSRSAVREDRYVKNSTNKGRKKKEKVNKKLVSIALILALVLGIGSYMFFSGGKKEYMVPDIMDKTLEEAMVLAEEAGFKIDEDNITYVTSDDFEEGKIMKQDPGANTYVRRNSKPIRVVISQGLGEGDIEVPDVVGLEYAKAAAELRAAKLQYKKIEEDSAEVPKNEVIRQSPKEGTRVTENYVVILHVSTGEAEETPEPSKEPELIKVPKLIGNSIENAEAILKASGLKRGNISREDSELEEGTVITQSPKAGSESPEGSYVNLVVSSGKATATPEPTIEPTPNKPVVTQQPEPTEALKKKTIMIDLPQTESGTVHVKAVANGATIHDANHQTSEEQVAISVAARTDATVEIYFDGVLQLTKVVKF